MFNHLAGWRVLSAIAVLAVTIAVAGSVSAQVHGAVFITDEWGNQVEAQHFDKKEDVFVNGGPRKPGAAGLPDGEYHIMVTNPSGAQFLGSSIVKFGAENPPIQVVDGEFVDLYRLWDITNHFNGGGSQKRDGYGTTNNNGGVYKVWVSMDPTFPNHLTKTKTFKVKKNGNGGVLPPDIFIKAYKFRDTNGDGNWDQPQELPIPGWEIRLYDGATLVQTLFTDGGGLVEFVVPQNNTKTYTVTEVIPAGQGWAATTPISVNVLADGNANPVEFGNWKPINLCVEKFRDSNGNGIKDQGELPINNWKFDLEMWDGASWEHIDTVYTDSTGKACYGPVDADGTLYRWCEDLTGGWVVTNGLACREVTAQLNPVTPLFLNWRPVNIEAFKFYDTNDNGTKQGSEPFIPGWKIELRTTGDVVLDTKLTDAGGKVTFTVDADGKTYKVVEIMPLDTATVKWFNTTPLFQNVTVNDTATKTVMFGNVAKSPIAINGYGLTKGFWQNQNGRAMMAPCYPDWVDDLNDLCLRWPNGDKLVIPKSGHEASHAYFADWIVGQGVEGNRAYAMSTQFAAIYLNTLCGPLSGYTDLHVEVGGNLVPLATLFDQAKALLCDPANAVVDSSHPKHAEFNWFNDFFDAMNNSKSAGGGPGEIPVYAWQIAPPIPAFSYS